MKTKTRFIIAGVVMLALSLAMLFSVRTASADTVGCPDLSSDPTGRQTSNLVGAYFTTVGNDATYFFDSFVNRSPVDGVPGLIKYCVYSGTAPDSVTTVAVGADLNPWTDPAGFDFFAFGRQDGNPNNIPLDGRMDYEMGTATWSGDVPAEQTILLHINDAAECDRLYGGNPGTCFVLPGEVQPPQPPEPSKTAIGSYDLTYTWDISKKLADDDPYTQNIPEGGSATFNYVVSVHHDAGEVSNISLGGDITVNNPNVDTITGVTITDAVKDEPNATCIVTGGEDATLAPGPNVFPYSCTYTEKPASDSETNIATMTWPTQTLSNGELPGDSIDIPKDFTFTVNPIDECVTVTDPNAPDGVFPKTVCVGDDNPTVIPYSQSFSGVGGTCTDYTNVATATTNDTVTPIESPPVIVTVCVGKDLTVSKTATPTFTRTYKWKISKAVTPKIVKQIGGTATFNYTVKAWETGFLDSLWAVAGTITVTNPNDWEAITADVTDAVPGGDCYVTGGTGVEVAAGASVDLPYTCTFALQPPYNTDLTNTATATWDKDKYFTPTGSASGEAKFQFTTPTQFVDKTVNITDTFNGGTPEPLGMLTATDEPPYASATFTYSRTVPVPTWNCKTYKNIAKIVETGQYAKQWVKVCGPIKTGALTMGFWQNPNGQGIIKGQALTGVCPSATWLQQYAPFQDLSATATCSQVATYVTNIIKAANASGSSMNAMLKAQMLATALDVYFSDPALGGNKINAPAPIGGVAIDLTKVCKNIGGGCTIFENVSSAFGGATSMTIQAMINYAASQSNAGGSLWYGNVKATQGLAKDAFDAINNQKVFAP